MEAQPIVPKQFYAELNHLVDDYQQAPNQAKLDSIYALIEHRFQQVDLSSEVQELKQLKGKLKEAHVGENHKVMQLVKEALNFPESKAKRSSQEKQAIDWEHMLPPELWKEISAYLEDDINKMPKLSKGFHKLSNDPSMQALIIEKYANRLSFNELIEFSRSCGSFVQKLDLSHLKDLSDNELASLIQAYPNLRTLNLSRCTQITDQGLAALTALQQLRTLNLSGCNIGDEGLKIVAQLKNLQALDLSDCLKITGEELKTLAKLPNLRTLDISRCHYISDKEIAGLAQLQHLETLILSECHMSDQGLTFLTQLKDLKELNLSRCSQITDQGLAIVAKSEHLQTLSLWDCWRISDQGLTSLTTLQELQGLDLSECDKITDEGLRTLSQLPSLQYLRLIACTGITDDGISSVKIKKIVH